MNPAARKTVGRAMNVSNTYSFSSSSSRSSFSTCQLVHTAAESPTVLCRVGTARPESRPYRARPNPSLKGSANGRPPGPGRWYAVHFHRPGPDALPLSPP